MLETITAWLETVQEQIRWKRARPVLIQELARHLEDQREEFLKEGKSPEEAERLAVRDMGDPVSAGTELDAVHRPRPQWGLLALTLALAAAGAVLRAVFHDQPGSPAILTGKILVSLGLGTAALLGMYFLDVSRLVRHARAVYIAVLAAGVLGLRAFPHATHPAYYAGYAALLFPVAYTLWFYSFRGKGWTGLFHSIAGGVPLALICAQTPSAAALLTLLSAGLIMTLWAAWRDWFGTGRGRALCAVLGITSGILIRLFYRGYFSAIRVRLQTALHPELDRQGRGFTGWMLRTFWEDVLPLGQLGSEASAGVNAGIRVGWRTRPVDFSSDFLPASMAVAWGWIPLLLLVAALTVLLLWLLVKGLRQSYLPGRLTVVAVVLTLGFQTLLSTALNFGFVLFAASLPLVVGNLQTVMDMALIGLALSVFRGDSAAREKPPLQQRKRLRIRFEYQ